MYQQHMLLKSMKHILKYKQVSFSLALPLLNISNCQSVLKYLSTVYIYMTAISMNYAFAKLLLARLYFSI